MAAGRIQAGDILFPIGATRFPIKDLMFSTGNIVFPSGTIMFPVVEFLILLGIGLAALIGALVIFQKRELTY